MDAALRSYRTFVSSYSRKYYVYTPSLSSGKSEGKTAAAEREEWNDEIERFCDVGEPLSDYGALSVSFSPPSGLNSD